MAEPFVTIVSPWAPPRILGDRDEAIGFTQEEMNNWRWIGDVESPLRDAVKQRVDGLLSTFRRSIDDGSHAHQALKVFSNIGLPMSKSPFAEFIAGLAESDVDLALATLGIAIGGVEVNLRARLHQRAFAMLVSWDQQLTRESVEANRRSLEALATSARRQEAGARTQGNLYAKRLEEHQAWFERALQVGIKWHSHRLQQKRLHDDSLLKGSLDDMAATKQLYMEHMALSAPVEYWKGKARDHKSKADQYRINLIGFSITAAIVLLFSLYLLADHSIAIAVAEKPATVYLILATIGLVMTTIVFWVARVMTRLYLSEMHLRMDAEERATMVQTYLALTSANQASKEDRAIVLASLFRPTADGIVKDDAAPDMSAAGILSKALGR